MDKLDLCYVYIHSDFPCLLPQYPPSWAPIPSRGPITASWADRAIVLPLTSLIHMIIFQYLIHQAEPDQMTFSGLCILRLSVFC